MKKIIAQRNYIIAFIIAIILFLWAYGAAILNPENTAWLLDARHDWGTHYLGWAFYRNEPWSFPLGKIDNYNYPFGTNVGLTDSIPIMAMLFKPLAHILPDDFQYLGFWLLLCQILVAFYTVKIFNLYHAKTVYVVLGVILVAGNSVLIYRGIHPSLCTQGLIVASIYYYLKPATQVNASRINLNNILITLLSALITPYFTVIAFGFVVIIVVKHFYYDRAIKLRQAIIYPIATFVCVFILWYIIGMVSFDSTNLVVQGGYGLYGFNLNSFYNSSGFSSFIPSISWLRWQQYEGYMYLGLGMMIIIILSTSYLLLSGDLKSFIKKNSYLLPLFLLALGLMLFAITNEVTYGEKMLFKYPLPAIVVKLGEMFRATGRFVWLVYYLLLLFFTLVFIKSKFPHSVKIALLTLLVALQLYDIKPIYTNRNLKPGVYHSLLDEQQWNKVLPSFDKMITYPPANLSLLANYDYQDLANLAIKNHMAISTGYCARDNVKGNLLYTDSLNVSFNKGIIKNDEIYVTTPAYFHNFKSLIDNKKAVMQSLDGYCLIYSKDKKIPTIKIAPDGSAISASPKVRIAEYIKEIDREQVLHNDDINYNIEIIKTDSKKVVISGWALFSGLDSANSNVQIVLIKAKNYIILSTTKVVRPDVTSYFKLPYNADDAGFNSVYDLVNIEPGEYKIGIYLINKKGKKEGLIVTDKIARIQESSQK